jgi:FtsX-like permease family
MARGVQHLLAADPGIRFDRLAAVDPGLDRHGVTAAEAAAYWLAVTRTLQSHPEVESLSLTSLAPLGTGVNSARYGADSGPLTITVLHVEPSFFELMHIPILRGRALQAGDAPSTVVVSERVALTMYGTLDVLGKGYPRSTPNRTIVGVAADAMVVQLHVSNAGAEYMPIAAQHLARAVLVARSRASSNRLVEPMLEAARTADPRLQPAVRLLAREYERNLRTPTLAGSIAALTAALVLALACFGIFGVVAYAAKLRTKEIGIRRALGASGRRVCETLLRQLAWPVGVGAVLGTAAGMLASRLLGGAPLYLAVVDAAAPAAALIVFALAALAAALLPAIRAIHRNPIEALRHE